MSSIRHPAVSGTFYPAGAAKLQRMVNEMIQEVEAGAMTIKALIAPHAGYIYSGPVAASAYANVAVQAKSIKRVVLFGPSHRVGFIGIAAPVSSSFETPLGCVDIDHKAIESVLDLPWVQRSDYPHAQEHSLEVQLPFLQTVLDDFLLVPMVVGNATPKQVAEVIDRLWGGG